MLICISSHFYQFQRHFLLIALVLVLQLLRNYSAVPRTLNDETEINIPPRQKLLLVFLDGVPSSIGDVINGLFGDIQVQQSSLEPETPAHCFTNFFTLFTGTLRSLPSVYNFAKLSKIPS